MMRDSPTPQVSHLIARFSKGYALYLSETDRTGKPWVVCGEGWFIAQYADEDLARRFLLDADAIQLP